MMDDDAEIIAEFLVESHENLDQLDRDLVELEQHPGSRELLSSIFRTIHTIKGTSGFLALGRLEKLTHVGETLLSQLRDGQKTMTPPIAEALLRMVDTVRALLDVIERTGKDEDASVDVAPVAALIEALLAGEEQAADVPEVLLVPAAAVAEPDGVRHAGSNGVAVLERTEVADVPPVPPAPRAPEAQVAPEPEPQPVPAAEEPAAPAEVEEDPAERRTLVDASVRVDVDLLDNLVQLVGELVLTRNQLLQRTLVSEDVELIRAGQRLDLVASELQESVMKTRMQPIGQVWSKMPRMVRDLSHQLGREVELVMEGHETELDRSLLEALKGPLTHLVRNSMDHGIEKPDERLAAGKSRSGRLHLRAFHESGQVVVEITDDGKGINPDKIASVAIERGVVSREQIARMDTREIVNLIFRPGFSTASEVTNVSGRGVGMDVVRTNIERIGGSVDLQSEAGRGTTVRVRIPLTLAIIPALVVGENGERYAIPQANLVELVRLEADDRNLEFLDGAPVLRLRGRLLPLVSLSEALGGRRVDGEALSVVVLQSDDVRFGLCVSAVHDTQEIVVKPIGRQLKSLAMYAGATIMGDGRVSLILDVAGLAREQSIDATQTDATEVRATDDDRTQLLVLEVAGGRRAALPLAAVARLEEFDRDRVERSGAAEVVQYRGGLLPLVRLAPTIGLPDTSDSHDQMSVVVHERANRAVGIVIDRVLDVVEIAVSSSQVGSRPGVTGTAVVQDRVTDLVDIEAVVAWAGASA
ncbi:chemotaxis protein CheA [Nocardioides sp. CER19]|uniref:chemotaxis protein CheA n=1 Tax=Nocardioides sp. CER19 TaxID=3038538 RepID=UPI002448B964|nr:chemotaxis protein CheA [Nocardioides sp. CER19]MDH2414654.1 chemotaxis protein CheA [Nocardioides sp. CER19]